MDIILVSSRGGDSRSIHLGGRQFAYLLLLLTGLVIAATATLQYGLQQLSPDGWGGEFHQSRKT